MPIRIPASPGTRPNTRTTSRTRRRRFPAPRWYLRASRTRKRPTISGLFSRNTTRMEKSSNSLRASHLPRFDDTRNQAPSASLTVIPGGHHETTRSFHRAGRGAFAHAHSGGADELGQVRVARKRRGMRSADFYFYRRSWKAGGRVRGAVSDFRPPRRFDGPVGTKRRGIFAGLAFGQEKSALGHCIQEGDTAVFCRVQLPQGKNLVRPMQLCRPLYPLRVDQLPRCRETPVG